MRIFLGTLFFALTVFPNSVESISENLRQLFPESDGVIFPPIRTFRNRANLRLNSLRRIVNGEMIRLTSRSFLVARAHVIIGWKNKDIIRPISNLFGETDNVFDMNRNRFVSLSREELTQLGVDPRVEVDTHLAFIRAADQAANTRNEIHRANHHANPHANQGAIHQAIQRAHYQASQYAYMQATQQAEHRFSIDQNLRASTQRINEAYQQAYQNYMRRGRN